VRTIVKTRFNNTDVEFFSRYVQDIKVPIFLQVATRLKVSSTLLQGIGVNWFVICVLL